MGKVFHENDENVRYRDGPFKLLHHVSDVDSSDICLFRWHGLHFESSGIVCERQAPCGNGQRQNCPAGRNARRIGGFLLYWGKRDQEGEADQ